MLSVHFSSQMTDHLPPRRGGTAQLELFQPLDVTRPDINIGKWSTVLFSSPWARNLYEPKVHTWTGTFEGREVTASITITPRPDYKRPTTTTYKVLLGLIQIWEQSGKPADGRVRFSARNLAKILSWKWGGWAAQQIQEQLTILKATQIDWSRSYALEGHLERQTSGMSYIDAKDYLELKDRDSEEIFAEHQTVRLNLDMVQNMLTNNTRPVRFKVYLGIKNEGSARLYSILDLVHSHKDHWQRRSHALFYDDLEFDGERYAHRRIRLAKLKKMVADLDGCDLSRGAVRLHITTTADGNDYKLVSRLTPFPKTKSYRWPSTPANNPDDIPRIVNAIIDGLQIVQPGRAHISRQTLTHLAHWYPEGMLMRQLSVLKADYRETVKQSAIRAFIYLVHVEAHRRGLDWIKDCSPDCRHRPENRNLGAGALPHSGNQK